MEQRSSEWYELRLGKFTASETHKLMGIKGLGETGKSYAFEKAIEQLYGQIDENYESYDMQRGTEIEPLAFQKFKELMSAKFIDVTNCDFFVSDNDSGASPDGLVGDFGVLEIKCPKSKAFFKMVAEGEYDKNYFYQVQKQLHATKRKKGFLFFYTIHEGNEFYHLIEIDRDQTVIDLIVEREKEACELKQGYMKKIQSNKQWKDDIKNIEVFSPEDISNEEF